MEVRKSIIALVAGLLLVLMAVGGNAVEAGKGKISIAGSTALLPLMKQAAADFMQRNPGKTVEVNGGGSFTGLNLVAAGSVDIGTSDVEAPDEYKGKNLVEYRVAVAPFIIIVHPDVPVTSLTQKQLVDIFTGKITNWKQVGGKDQPITIIHRPRSSGSRATIKAIVLKDKEFTDRAIIQDSNGAVRAAIASTPGSIGYVDAAYLDNTVKAIAYNGVPYSKEAVIQGKYPIYAYERMYTKGQPEPEVEAFIQFVLSPEFQNKYVEKLGFIPVRGLQKR